MTNMKKEFEVEKGECCKQVNIPKGYCMVKLQNISIDDVEISQNGKDVDVEILCADFECIKTTHENENTK